MDLNDVVSHTRLLVRAESVREPSEQRYGKQEVWLKMLEMSRTFYLSTPKFNHLRGSRSGRHTAVDQEPLGCFFLVRPVAPHV